MFHMLFRHTVQYTTVYMCAFGHHTIVRAFPTLLPLNVVKCLPRSVEDITAKWD